MDVDNELSCQAASSAKMYEAARREPVLAERMDLLFCCNTRFYRHLAVTLISILENNPDVSFAVHLVTSDCDSDARRMLLESIASFPNHALHEYILPVDDLHHLPTGQHITLETYLRILALDMLPTAVGKVLYLDCDIVVVGSLVGLWQTDLQQAVLAAAPSPYADLGRARLGMPAESVYVNAGVLLIDVRRWQADRIASRLIRYMEEHKGDLVFHDQDAINAVLHHSIKIISLRWNFHAMMFKKKRYYAGRFFDDVVDESKCPVIIHFCSSRKPWIFGVFVPARDLYGAYEKKTAWRAAGDRSHGLGEWCVCMANLILYRCGSDDTWQLLREKRFGGNVPRRLVGLPLRWLKRCMALIVAATRP